MRSFLVYIGVALLVVGASLGVYWINGPLSENTVADGSAFPGDGNGLAFYSPANGSTTFTVSYLYANSNASVSLYRCTVPSVSCASTNDLVGPLRSTTGAYNVTGTNGQGTWVEQGGSQNWYVVETNEPLVVIVKVPLSTLGSLAEVASIGMLVAGLGLTLAGFLLRDLKRRPAPRLAQLKRTLYFFFQNKLAVVGLAILIFFVIVAIVAPILAPYAPSYYVSGPNTANGTNLTLPYYCTISATPPMNPLCGGSGGTPILQAVCTSQYASQPCLSGDVLTAPNPSFANVLPPTWSYTNLLNPGPLPLGSLTTDVASGGTGYYVNIYQGLIRGTPWDLGVSAVVVLAGASVGIILGSIAGYVGGVVDEIIMRLTDIFLAVPSLLLTIVLLISMRDAYPKASEVFILELLVFSFIIVWWPSYTRLVRGQVLVTREQKYVEAARASGATSGRIIRKHIIPNSVYPVFVSISLDVGVIPLLLGTLAFLGFNQSIGFGIPANDLPTFPEWGSIASSGVSDTFIGTLFTNANTPNPVPFPWWQFLFPGLTLFLFAIAVNFLSDGLRDALDPRLRR